MEASALIEKIRNILVYEYLEVDSQIVYAIATDHLDDYEEFARRCSLGRAD
jgi:uncharacterized protein YutE (UPF0331/DUF86 family)